MEREVRWPEYVAMARAAEEVGFDSIWVGDHYLYRDDGRPERGPWEAWTLLAGLAAVTERVRLGPLVACLAFHNPAVLAKQAATVADLSGDRLTVGVGAGWNRTEFDAFGIPFDQRASRFEESFEIVRRLLAGERVTVDGRWHRTRDAVLLPRLHRRPRVMVGSTGARVLAATLPHVDVWNTWYDWYGNTPEGFAAKRGEIDGACDRVGRDPATLERSACVLVRFGDAGERPDDGRPALAGPEGVGAGLRAFADAGADEVILVVDPITETTIRAMGGALASPGHERYNVGDSTSERDGMPTARTNDVTDDGTAGRCARHTCCIHAPHVDVVPGFDHLRGEWHLQWVPGDGAWFLAPPKGNVFEIRVAAGEDPVAALDVEGAELDEVRHAIVRDSLFPPC